MITAHADSGPLPAGEIPPAAQPANPSQAESLALPPQEREPGQVTEKVTLPPGKTLRLLALELYGNREFWVYIYLENKEKITNPNRVPSGAVLVLPGKSAYSIDAADPHSVAKAKSLGDELLKGF